MGRTRKRPREHLKNTRKLTINLQANDGKQGKRETQTRRGKVGKGGQTERKLPGLVGNFTRAPEERGKLNPRNSEVCDLL